MYPSSLWGPSLDQLDHVVERCLLPELSLGDWLLFSNMGACGLDELRSLQLPVYYAVSTSDWCVPSRTTLPTQAEGFVGHNSTQSLVSSGLVCRFDMQEAGVALDSAVKNFSTVACSA